MRNRLYKRKRRCNRNQFHLTKNVSQLRVVSRRAPAMLPRKVMVVGYFAESKGVVGWQYRCHLVFKVRDLYRF